MRKAAVVKVQDDPASQTSMLLVREDWAGACDSIPLPFHRLFMDGETNIEAFEDTTTGLTLFARSPLKPTEALPAHREIQERTNSWPTSY